MGAGAAVCCCALRDPHVGRSYAIAKWAYCGLFTVITIVTWVLRDYSDEWFLRSSSAVLSYCQIPGLETLCSSKQVAIRFSFANFAFFGAHAILLFWCTREADPRAGIHSGLWLWKLLLWAGAIVGFFFVPSSAMAIYSQAARVGAALFLVFVMVEMVSWVYDVNARLVAADTKLAWAALILGAAVTFAGGVALVGASYHFYAPSPKCHLNLFFITWTLVTGMLLIAILFVPRRLEAAGLLTSGAVFAYGAFLLYSALGRAPAGDCARPSGSEKWVQIVGFFLGIGAVCYSTMGLGTSSIFGGGSGIGGGGGSGGGLESGGGGGDSDGTGALPYRPDAFHLMYALASMYMAMLLTSWQVSPSTQKFELGAGAASMWATLASKWFCELLYAWTVVAPAILRNRDFT